MAFLKRAVVLLMFMAGLEVSMGAVYKVGDSVGWTTIGHFDYKKWASSKTFHVGDIINFEYHTEFHNVMQVSHTHYQSCNSSAPMATYTTGNDSITIQKIGHYFFICGTTGHCQLGQKVDINVVNGPSSITPTASAVSPSAMTPPSSPKNSAPLISKGFLGMVALALALAIFAG